MMPFSQESRRARALALATCTATEAPPPSVQRHPLTSISVLSQSKGEACTDLALSFLSVASKVLAQISITKNTHPRRSGLTAPTTPCTQPLVQEERAYSSGRQSVSAALHRSRPLPLERGSALRVCARCLGPLPLALSNATTITKDRACQANSKQCTKENSTLSHPHPRVGHNSRSTVPQSCTRHRHPFPCAIAWSCLQAAAPCVPRCVTAH
jgi:hypothetical protein